MTDVLINAVQDKSTTGGLGALVMESVAPQGRRTMVQGLAEGESATFRFEGQTSFAWEHRSGCTRTGTSLSRGTLLDSSTGSAINFTVGEEIKVTLIQDATQIVAATGFTMSGRLNWATAATVSAAAVAAVFAAASNYILMPGTVSVAAFDAIAQGAEVLIRTVDGHVFKNGANLICWGGQDYTAVAGDETRWISEGGGVARMTQPVRAKSANVHTGTDDTMFLTPKSLIDAVAPVAVAFASSVSLNLASGLNFEIGLMTANFTLANPSGGMDPGRSGSIYLPQDSVGSRTLTLGSYWRHTGGAPTASTAADAKDKLWWFVDNATAISCNLTNGHA